MSGREGSEGSATPVVGSAVGRKEDERLLRGRARFVDDVHLPRMLHGVFVRSPHPHAEIAGIEASAALAAGARLVLTAGDLPFADRDFVVRYWHQAIRGGRQPVLARGRARYVGEPVALLVADDPYQAEDLTALVEVDYRPLESVAGTDAAMRSGAPALHDSWTGNVAARFSYERGDAAGALSRAARRVGHQTSFARQIPLPLETRGALADFDGARGHLTVRLSTQAHYNVRENLATLLDLPESAVRVVCEDVGGGFGAKSRCYGEEIVLAEASRLLGRPVKWIEDRRENMLATAHSRGIDVALEFGLAADGAFEALRARVVLDVGAYVFTSGIATAELCGALIPGAYRIPDFSVEVLAVGTNNTPAATYRGAGQPEAALAIETLVDRAAGALGMDAARLRRRNLVRPDDLPHATGTGFGGAGFAFLGGDFPALLDRVRAESGYGEAVETRPGGVRTAWGLAGGVDVSGVVNFESASIRIGPSGEVCIASGMSSQGQGQATIFAQIAADALGADIGRVSVALGDTALLPFGRGAFASRGAIMGGSAVLEAAKTLRARILAIAARLLQDNPAGLDIAAGRILRRDGTDSGLGIGDAARAVAPGGALFDGAAGLEAATVWRADEPATLAYSVHAARVAVDPETGSVEILDYTVGHDIGRALNPAIVRGQVAGGALEGIANALLTEMKFAPDGQPLTLTLADYLAPVADGAPVPRLVEQDTPSPTNPLGIRGVGESATIAPPAAIWNAVARAMGWAAPARVPISPAMLALHQAIGRDG
ncbi:MAG: xanthine dehydrogenase family protein molybdopterin-binding subunit [Defluviicoccus sp.]|nr:xanthine dehydrogenase family protein molybdopterin-binding subunit [Defluviicoccus sp.]MDE0384470.1 xanthine dehydrogenase family protein molybdopterin-binding subunit [Defluviicoccus sp.]